jgi:folate-binding protein YgfZ
MSSDRTAAAFATLQRAQVEITGKDRVRLVHGLCTNDLNRLQAGDGCEAFLTNAQGRVMGYVQIFVHPESLTIESVSGQAANIIDNLDRYVVREDVRFTDRSQDWSQRLVCGISARDVVRKVFENEPPQPVMSHQEMLFSGGTVCVRRTRLAGVNCFQISGETGLLAELDARLVAARAHVLDEAVVESLRIESGTPLFGVDITPENLPQEVDRNQEAISFTKGCYLGQETVARIDALGHVNRYLRGLRFAGDKLPPLGSQLLKEDKPVAKVTSVCWSSRLNGPLALAYVRRGSDAPGTIFDTPWGQAEITRLPLLEPDAATS